jgi:hypothetical protein
MTISELITKLQELKDIHGDVEVKRGDLEMGNDDIDKTSFTYDKDYDYITIY